MVQGVELCDSSSAGAEGVDMVTMYGVQDMSVDDDGNCMRALS